MFVKVWVAAADDRDLYERVVPFERMLAALDRRARLGARGRAEDRVFLVLSALRGLALTERFEPRDRPSRDRWPALRELLAAACPGYAEVIERSDGVPCAGAR